MIPISRDPSLLRKSDARDEARAGAGVLPKVLMMESLPINIAFAKTGLSDLCAIIGAENGEEGLRLALEHRPDLIILGSDLPDIDRFELCRRLKDNAVTQIIPIIFISVPDSSDLEERALRSGAIDYIAKPFNPEVLRARLRNHLLLVKQRQQLERLSQLDGLTGIPNRRVFDQFLADEWMRHSLLRRPLSLLMIDIDFFKLYNDHFGHLAGDKTLRDVAWAILETLGRQTDLAARYGGEEFACVMPDTDEDGARTLGEAIREKVEKLDIPHPLSEYKRVTVSVGAAAVIPSERRPSQALVDLADRNLYQAKKSGRNRLVLTS